MYPFVTPLLQCNDARKLVFYHVPARWDTSCAWKYRARVLSHLVRSICVTSCIQLNHESQEIFCEICFDLEFVHMRTAYYRAVRHSLQLGLLRRFDRCDKCSRLFSVSDELQYLTVPAYVRGSWSTSSNWETNWWTNGEQLRIHNHDTSALQHPINDTYLYGFFRLLP